MSFEYIHINRDTCGGKPVVRGTRFSVGQLIAELADGRSLKEIANDFDLDEDSLRCALLDTCELLRTLA